MERIYLDNAATTPIDKEVQEAMLQVMEHQYGNPSSIHAHGRAARTIVEQSRKSIATLLNTSPSEIFFTSGGTEADNTAIASSINTLGISHAITSTIEHHAVKHTLRELEKAGKVKLNFVNVDDKGNIDINHLEQLLANNPRSLVSLMHANNEIGTLTDIERVGELCEQYDAIYHCDTVQTMGHYPHDLQKLKLHFLACAAHKFHGPKGVGFLHINHRVKIAPILLGGAQERNMRGGTENIYGIVGLAKALQIAYAEMPTHHTYIQGLKTYMIEQLQLHIPDIRFNGETDSSKSLYTVLNVSFPATAKSEMLLFNLDIAGISASGGSACSSGSNIGSHVLTGIQADPQRPSIRFSFSKYNKREEIDLTIQKLKQFLS